MSDSLDSQGTGRQDNSLYAQAPSRSTWAVFCALLLFASCWYTFHAFQFDFTVGRGRPGPGFGPRAIGVSLILCSLYIIASGWRRYESAKPSSFRRTTLLFAAGSAAFLVIFSVLGAWIGIALYLLGSLSWLNAGRVATNLALTFVIPLIFFLLFYLWLSVPLPEGIFFIRR